MPQAVSAAAAIIALINERPQNPRQDEIEALRPSCRRDKRSLPLSWSCSGTPARCALGRGLPPHAWLDA